MAASQRIAVIGTGIGGLTVAWLLRQRHAVTLYEQHGQPGMGVYAVDYVSAGRTTRIDIPTRVFCEGYYPQLMALLTTVGVRMHATDHSAAYADERGRVQFHYGKASLLGLSQDYLKTVGPRALKVAADSLRFFRNARRDLQRQRERLAQQTLGDYLEAGGYGAGFVDGVLLPTLSVICTCDYAGVRRYPADLLLDYLASGVMKQGVLRAELGVGDIVTRLVDGLDQVCGVAVAGIAARGAGYEVVTSDGDARQYDRVVLATQAQQAADILGPGSEFTPLLRQVPFEQSVMRVHTDASVLPRSRLPLSPVTYRVVPDAPRPEVTVHMTQAFPTYRGQASVFQTWNPLRPVRAGTQLAEAGFTRPLVTRASRAAMETLRRRQAAGDTDLLFCGAYMGDRVPLLEAAVESSVRVATQLGAPPPWGAVP